MKSGVDLIKEERERQIKQEGWDSVHDDKHARGQLAIAAACYAAKGSGTEVNVIHSNIERLSSGYIEEAWPWSPKWDKRGTHDDKRCLVIAGALIAAEIDRLNRKEKGGNLI